MHRTPKLYEKELYSVWQNKAFESELTTRAGDEIDVINPGEFNRDSSGPDFLNARIQIGNLTYIGDVEIDREYNDWKHHGHNIDRKYNKVVLHICFNNKYRQSYVYNKDGRKIPSLCLSDFLSEAEIQKINQEIDHRKKELSHSLKCIEHQQEVQTVFKKKFIGKLGIQRFEKKCLRMYGRLKQLKYLNELHVKEPDINYDLSEEFQNRNFNPVDFKDKKLWEQLLYEYVFEALGFSKNKNAMLKLARLVKLNFVEKLERGENFPLILESTYFYVAGLGPDLANLPAETNSEYVRKLGKTWEAISRIYDGGLMDETEWHFFKLRPHNFPTIRIAGGVDFVLALLERDLIGKIIRKFTEIRKDTVLIGSIRSLFIYKSHGYWQSHYVFNKKGSNNIKYFIGSARADEIMVNVILPFLSVYFDIFGKTELSKKVLHIYNAYHQKNTNKIVHDVSENIGMEAFLSKTVFIQGMIELFRLYCSKSKCLECDLGKQVFN